MSRFTIRITVSNIIKKTLTATRNSSKSDNDDLLKIDKLLLGIRQKSMLVRADLNRDNNDNFIDIDKLLSCIQQKSVLASADSNSNSITEMINNST